MKCWASNKRGTQNKKKLLVSDCFYAWQFLAFISIPKADIFLIMCVAIAGDSVHHMWNVQAPHDHGCQGVPLAADALKVVIGHVEKGNTCCEVCLWNKNHSEIENFIALRVHIFFMFRNNLQCYSISVCFIWYHTYEGIANFLCCIFQFLVLSDPEWLFKNELFKKNTRHTAAYISSALQRWIFFSL